MRQHGFTPWSHDCEMYEDHAFGPERTGIATNFIAENGREVLAFGPASECAFRLRAPVIHNWGERPMNNLIFPV